MTTTTATNEEEIGAQEAARLLKRHVYTVQEMCRTGRIEARRAGGVGPWIILTRNGRVVTRDSSPAPMAARPTSTPAPAPDAPPSK